MIERGFGREITRDPWVFNTIPLKKHKKARKIRIACGITITAP